MSGLLHQRVFGRERFPLRAVQPQRVGQTAGVYPVALVAAGPVALAVALGAFGIHGVDRDAAFQQLLYGGTLAGLDGHAEGGETAEAVAAELPTGGGVLETEFGHDLAARLDDDNLMLGFGPVEAGVMREGRE